MQPTFMPSSFVERPHPVGVALGEVVVHRGEVGALAFERGEIQRQRGGERLAFAGLHLDDRVDDARPRRPGAARRSAAC